MTASINKGRSASLYPNLGKVTAELRELRIQSHRARYGGGSLPDLPSRKAIIEIVNGLTAALFPRHFGPPGLTGESLDAFVTFALAEMVQSLQQQVQLQLELTSHDAQASVGDHADHAYHIAAAFMDDLARVRAILESDIRAAYEDDPEAVSLDVVMCSYPGVAAIIRHRLAHGLYRLGAKMLARIISEVAHSETGIDIHPGAQIGESFFIDHGTGVVIGETTVIGKRVRLYQGVTLGARRFAVGDDGVLLKNYQRHPTIGDDVVIYAGATVLGPITVGQGSTIAGSVWLTSSVPAGSTVTQAKVLRTEAFSEGGGI